MYVCVCLQTSIKSACNPRYPTYPPCILFRSVPIQALQKAKTRCSTEMYLSPHFEAASQCVTQCVIVRGKHEQRRHPDPN